MNINPISANYTSNKAKSKPNAPNFTSAFPIEFYIKGRRKFGKSDMATIKRRLFKILKPSSEAVSEHVSKIRAIFSTFVPEYAKNPENIVTHLSSFIFTGNDALRLRKFGEDCGHGEISRRKYNDIAARMTRNGAIRLESETGEKLTLRIDADSKKNIEGISFVPEHSTSTSSQVQLQKPAPVVEEQMQLLENLGQIVSYADWPAVRRIKP